MVMTLIFVCLLGLERSVGRAGRFGTKGLAVSFISTEADEAEMKKVQERFAVQVPELPDVIDTSVYM